jgi:hypothetical protein
MSNPRHLELGKLFHDQFFSLVGTLHEDDPRHNEAVGRAVETTMQGDCDKATADYNEWAAGAGYVPILIKPEGDNFSVMFHLTQSGVADVTISKEVKMLSVTIR